MYIHSYREDGHVPNHPAQIEDQLQRRLWPAREAEGVPAVANAEYFIWYFSFIRFSLFL